MVFNPELQRTNSGRKCKDRLVFIFIFNGRDIAVQTGTETLRQFKRKSTEPRESQMPPTEKTQALRGVHESTAVGLLRSIYTTNKTKKIALHRLKLFYSTGILYNDCTIVPR